MSCSNCFNGCSEIVSDQCVRYTGIDVPALNIQNGDTLSSVEQNLIEFLQSALDGTGIVMDINPSIICTIVNNFLPVSGDLTLVDFTKALIQAVCSVKTSLDGLAANVAHIEAPYTTGCLTVSGGSSVTHQVVQAIITKLCTVEADLAALAIDLDTNYVKLSDLCSLVIGCIENSNPGGGTKHYLKMVPYTVVEYYGSIAGIFDSTGAGLGDWEKIYLCNGLNGTPDKRGRVGVGAIVGVPGGPLDAAVNPGGFNPNYALYDKVGSNSVTLITSQIPSHTHIPTVNVTEANGGHTHFCFSNAQMGDGAPTVSPTTVAAVQLTGVNDLSYVIVADPANNAAVRGLTNKVSVGIGVTVENSLVGSNQAHANNQPALACYYIMYIPS